LLIVLMHSPDGSRRSCVDSRDFLLTRLFQP
jgi:hypothetical protein